MAGMPRRAALALAIAAAISGDVRGHGGLVIPPARNTSACWKTTYGRGVGTIPESCVTPPNTDKDGALCYPRCRPTYYGVGPVVRAAAAAASAAGAAGAATSTADSPRTCVSVLAALP